MQIQNLNVGFEILYLFLFNETECLIDESEL